MLTNKSRTNKLFKAALGLAATLLVLAVNSQAGNNKIRICHFPPGNPDNMQEINVSVNAMNAHMAHGDLIGGCDELPPDEEIIDGHGGIAL